MLAPLARVSWMCRPSMCGAFCSALGRSALRLHRCAAGGGRGCVRGLGQDEKRPGRQAGDQGGTLSSFAHGWHCCRSQGARPCQASIVLMCSGTPEQVSGQTVAQPVMRLTLGNLALKVSGIGTTFEAW